MTTLSKQYSSDPVRDALLRAEAMRAEALQLLIGKAFTGLKSLLRRSRGLTHLLPSFMASGLLTLIATAVIHWTSAPVEGLVGTWLESWLIAWAIVWPVTFVADAVMKSIAASLAGSEDVAATATRRGYGLGDIAAGLARASGRNSFSVLRNLKVKEDLGA